MEPPHIETRLRGIKTIFHYVVFHEIEIISQVFRVANSLDGMMLRS